MYEKRLTVAHAEMDSTVSSYISFVTGHCGEDFEKAMAESSALAVHARKMLSERESLELELVTSGTHNGNTTESNGSLEDINDDPD